MNGVPARVYRKYIHDKQQVTTNKLTNKIKDK